MVFFAARVLLLLSLVDSAAAHLTRFKGDGDNLEFKKFSERRGSTEPDGKPRFRPWGEAMSREVEVGPKGREVRGRGWPKIRVVGIQNTCRITDSG